MLVTAEELASLMQQDVDTATATLAIEIATGVVQSAAGQRIIEVVDDEAVIDLDVCDNSLYLPLPERPVTDVTSATVGATVVTDYQAQLQRGRLWRSMGWRSATLPYWNAPSTVTVVYTHGYPVGHQRLQLARSVVFDLAKTGYNTAAGSGAIVSEQIDDYSVRYAEMAATIEAALDPDGPLARALRRQYGRPPGSVKLIAARG
ncbi:hypothetical protein [Actinoplanes italicus]|nr:hypothetical protein [Actinoplanes italicus]